MAHLAEWFLWVVCQHELLGRHLWCSAIEDFSAIKQAVVSSVLWEYGIGKETLMGYLTAYGVYKHC